MNSPKSRKYIVGFQLNDWEIKQVEKKEGFIFLHIQHKCGKNKIIRNIQFKTLGRCKTCLDKELEEKYIGKKFHDYLVISKLQGKRKDGSSLFLCKCKCGKMVKKATYDFKNGKSKKCFECFVKERKGLKNIKLSQWYRKKAEKRLGTIINNFKLISIKLTEKGENIFKVKCLFCNGTKYVRGSHLKIIKSCGCKTYEKMINFHRKLSNIDILSIRDLYSTGLYSVKDLAEQNGVSLGCIRALLRKETWKHVKDK